MKSLRESSIPQYRVTEAFHYPGYVIRIQKERQIRAKTKNLHEKLCTKTMSPNQLNFKLITKSNKKMLFAFFTVGNICKSNDAHYCDTVKENKNLQKRGEYAKVTKIGL